MDLFSLFFVIIAALIIGTFLYALFRQIQNLGQPLIAREARVVGKRQNVRGMSDSPTSTRYYVTFEFPDGSREELSVRPREYGLLAEGDTGTVRSQGTWYKGFDRRLQA